jgi:hypothetical protein
MLERKKKSTQNQNEDIYELERKQHIWNKAFMADGKKY